MPVNAQEREAYKNDDYKAHLEAIKESVYEDEKIRFLIEAAKARRAAGSAVGETGVDDLL